jgi:starvation-inducible DNA-binding protein
MLKGSPEHAFSKYLKMAEMKESEGISSASDSVLEVLGGLQLLIRKERELLEQASTGHDEGTAAMLSDYITSQEKLIWMYSAFIS